MKSRRRRTTGITQFPTDENLDQRRVHRVVVAITRLLRDEFGATEIEGGENEDDPSPNRDHWIGARIGTTPVSIGVRRTP